VTAARGFDGIDIPDQVSDGHVRRGQFFDVAIIRSQVSDRRSIALLRNKSAAAPADGRKGIVMDLAAFQVGQLRIEQRGQRAQNAALGLPAQPQQDKVVSRENGVDELRYDSVVIPDNPGKDGLAGAQLGDQIVA
jgi:hypothetical protein